MMIKRITVRNFGSVDYYDAQLDPKLTILDTHFTSEISTAVELLLCSKVFSAFDIAGVQENTQITAEVLLDGSAYFVELEPKDGGSLKLTATDVNGNDATFFYRHALSHCQEQDAIESFDGHDKSFPFRLCWYRGCDKSHTPSDLASRTNCMTKTNTFRSHLIRYIKAFEPQPINNQKNYQTAISKDGKFEVVYPGVSGEIPLSETEEKLFLYVCFLNVAEFWEDVEKIRDMHHEKKPLLIKNFLEFLDQTTDVHALVSRTVKLGRQVILLTTRMDQQTKKKWIGDIHKCKRSRK